MRSIQFRIGNELPPKKDGATSMWNKPIEARRLLLLRRAALESLNGATPFEGDIHLTMHVYVGIRNDRSAGDLDNYITGVCDGLMAANPRASIHESLLAPDCKDIHPSRTIAILDDSQVVSIEAKKLVGSDPSPWYKVSLTGW